FPVPRQAPPCGCEKRSPMNRLVPHDGIAPPADVVDIPVWRALKSYESPRGVLGLRQSLEGKPMLRDTQGIEWYPAVILYVDFRPPVIRHLRLRGGRDHQAFTNARRNSLGPT